MSNTTLTLQRVDTGYTTIAVFNGQQRLNLGSYQQPSSLTAMQPLAVYPNWASLQFQYDGNLVMYGLNGQPAWGLGTSSGMFSSAFQLELNDIGNASCAMSVLSSNFAVLWSNPRPPTNPDYPAYFSPYMTSLDISRRTASSSPMVPSAQDDDAMLLPQLPFQFYMFGVNLQALNMYIGSNSYITFGSPSVA